MPSCQACSAPVDPTYRFCPACGTPVGFADSPTSTAPPPAFSGRVGGAPTTPSSARTGGATGVASAGAEGRFVAGTLLAGRYRVVGLLGKGGMGEVYRADDLRLDQPVALKFLPAALQQDPARLERLYSEVRVARQVTHPAVCRVYDVGEAEGQHFLSMEYVDGENLASLLRRIGRLPPDKALDIARQLCAGVAAAHQKGVLHRDLKPANVMLDGEGRARILDFGLAGVVESFRGDEVRSGTPAYMSPEQLEGRGVTARSEVYSLGLVMFALFTGRRAFEGRSYAELLRQHREETPTQPSALVPEIEPAVERAILRCLEKDPQRRPASALAVAALLPGGDPLAAALAAGETPSPEMVAAAGEAEALQPRLAWGLLAAVLVGLLAVPWFARVFQIHNRVPADKPAEALEDRARELLSALGYDAAPIDTARGFAYDGEYFAWQRRRDASPRRWDGLASGVPPVMWFWYRQSPQPLVSRDHDGRVAWTEPPLDVAGMAGARFDLRGRLLAFYAIPPQVEDTVAAPGAAADWTPLLAAARLDPAALRPVAPQWTPPFYCDARAAWEGHYPGRSDLPLRVEASAYRGRPVAFFVVSPWTRAERAQPRVPTRLESATQASALTLLAVLLVGGGLLARRNLGLGRGDRRGAFRLAAFTCAAALGGWVAGADHVAVAQSELSIAARGAGNALLLATILWLFYLALEPYVRRLWPRAIVAWTRLLGGGVRDAVVGRDVLVGAAWGVGVAFFLPLTLLLLRSAGQAALEPVRTELDLTLGLRRCLASAIGFHLGALLLAMGSLLALTLLRLLLRRERLAALGLAALLTGLQAAGNFEVVPWLALPLALVLMGSYTWVLLRFGLLAAAIGIAVADIILTTPLTPDLGSWLGAPTLFTLAWVAALALHGFRHSLGRGPLRRSASA
jgi:serine/threonine-protein kinase